VARLN